jgi:hypothetical protein
VLVGMAFLACILTIIELLKPAKAIADELTAQILNWV